MDDCYTALFQIKLAKLFLNSVSIKIFDIKLLSDLARQKILIIVTKIVIVSDNKIHLKTISDWNNRKECSKENIINSCSIWGGTNTTTPHDTHKLSDPTKFWKNRYKCIPLCIFVYFKFSFTASQSINPVLFPYRVLFLFKVS